MDAHEGYANATEASESEVTNGDVTNESGNAANEMDVDEDQTHSEITQEGEEEPDVENEDFGAVQKAKKNVSTSSGGADIDDIIEPAPEINEDEPEQVEAVEGDEEAPKSAISVEDLKKKIFGDSDDDEDGESAAPRKLKRLTKKHGTHDEKKDKKKKKKKKSESDEEAAEGAEGADKDKKKKHRRKSEGDAKKKKKKKEKRHHHDGAGGGSDADVASPASVGDAADEDEPRDAESDGEARGSGSKATRTVRKKPQNEFDAMIEQIRAPRVRKRKDIPMDDFDQLFGSLSERMEQAAHDDTEANRLGQPALAKVKALPEVVNILGRVHLHQELVGHGVLRLMHQWLQPLPDGSLPALNIREELLRVLAQLPCDRETLKESGVGRVVMFLWKHKTETPENRKLCHTLIEKWSRPIFGLSAQYKDLEQMELDSPNRPKMQRRRPEEEEESLIDKKTREQIKDVRRIHAHIPERVAMDFVKRPVPQINPEIVPKSTRNPLELKLQKKLQAKRSNKNNVRAVKISVEGRSVIK